MRASTERTAPRENFDPARDLFAHALGDKYAAARYLAAFVRGEESAQADAGAILLADGLQTLRAIGTIKVTWTGGRD